MLSKRNCLFLFTHQMPRRFLVINDLSTISLAWFWRVPLLMLKGIFEKNERFEKFWPIFACFLNSDSTAKKKKKNTLVSFWKIANELEIFLKSTCKWDKSMNIQDRKKISVAKMILEAFCIDTKSWKVGFMYWNW